METTRSADRIDLRAVPSAPAGESTRDAEEERLAAVRRYDTLETPPNDTLDLVTGLAARALGRPIAQLSIVERHRIRYVSSVGLELGTVERHPGLCESGIHHDQPWIVEDARTDPRTCAHPLVAGDPGLGAYAGVPLTTPDGHNIGMLSVLDLEPRQVTDDEISTLQDLASLVMNELELQLATRTIVFRERGLRRDSAEVAHTLQQIALPSFLPQVPGLRIVAEYLPATDAQVGGDWYDAFDLDDTRVAVTIGDVAGHGMAAAAVMGQLRNAIRAYAYHGLGVGETLLELDDLLRHIAPELFATVAHLVIDTTTGEYRAANAGHLPPLLVSTSSCRAIQWQAAPPVGTGFATHYPETTGVLRTGERLLLYTDGLVERRGETLDVGIARLCQAVHGTDGHDVLDAALSLNDERDLSDDAALLILTRG
jgi:sigma-B regulation protein RsbU (phosphoserine phosphatase)